MTVLVLGGINEAVNLAATLHRQKLDIIYSIAGLVRQPELDCTVVSGGFSGLGGFAGFLDEESVSLVVDATHPYASQMSQQAAETCARLDIPCWRYLRPAWQAAPGDNWHQFDGWEKLLPALVDHDAVLFTAGRLQQAFIDSLCEWTRELAQKQWVRSATRPQFNIPPSMTWIEAIGPYELADERELLARFKIDAVVCKNSGGDHAAAKLAAARERGIPVYMLKRPPLAPVAREFDRIEDCANAVLSWHGGGDGVDD